jgi:hypothetical protein
MGVRTSDRACGFVRRLVFYGRIFREKIVFANQPERKN